MTQTARRCFVISPIGQPGSDIRSHADEVFEHIIKPALAQCNVAAMRSDHLNDPGRISDQMLQAILEYDLCIAVVTGANANVYYELAIAQCASRPVIILVASGEQLRFDIGDFRSMTYDTASISSYPLNIERLVRFVREFDANGWRGYDLLSKYRRADTSPAVDATSLGVKILSPTSGEVDQRVDAHGSFDRMPPLAFDFCSLRYYPHQHGFVPEGKMLVDRHTKTWQIRKFDLGGVAGDERGIVIAIAGSDAKILLQYWDKAHAVHSPVMKKVRELDPQFGKWLPAVTEWPSDLIPCARVEVTRR